jgi:hypothetical protein
MSRAKKWIDIIEFCNRFGWNVRTVRNRIAPGSNNPFPEAIRVVRIGKRVFINLADADQYHDELAEKQAYERAGA